MADTPYALIVGAGSGLSASLARRFAAEGTSIALAARDPNKLAALVEETGARAYACDASQADDVAMLFEKLSNDFGTLKVAVYN
ncbi:MAG: SDR family NAD(P)-dependent oxidoreductase, partial [Alphaproteobacteria bacterium]